MDAMFNDGRNSISKVNTNKSITIMNDEADIIVDIVTVDDQTLTDLSSASINKRKLASVLVDHQEPQSQENENKRSCNQNGHQ